MKPVSSLLCSLALSVAGLSAHAAENAASAPDPAKGASISTSVCAACHTSDGSRGSAANPIIQGQHPDYLVKQLAEFKAGKRDNPVMRAMASPLSEAT
jgi:cytochrome c553